MPLWQQTEGSTLMSLSSLFGNLSKGALQALPAIQGLVAAGGMSASAILASVRSSGLSIRTQTGLDIIGVLNNNVSAARAIRLQSNQQVLDPGLYGKAIGGLPTNFSYLVQFSGVNEKTGLKTKQHITVTSDIALSKDMILAKAQTYVTSGRYDSGIDVSTGDVRNALVSADYDTGDAF